MEAIEIKDYDKNFGVFAVINTSKCESWSGNPDPLITIVKSPEDFMNLGVEVATDGKPYTDLEVGKSVEDIDFGGDYEGVYVVRLA